VPKALFHRHTSACDGAGLVRPLRFGRAGGHKERKNMNLNTIISLLAIAVALACRVEAQDSPTNYFPLLCCSNRTYTNATIEKVNPVTVKIFWETSDEKIPITNLPPEVQARYYNPQEVQKYLDAQAAIAKAKSTLGPAQTIYLDKILPDGYLEIKAEGKVAEAYIHNLPPEILGYLRAIYQTEANIARLKQQVPHDSSGYVFPGTIGRNAKERAAQEALVKALSRLKELRAQFQTRSIVIARPTDYIIGAVIRQWEFQSVVIPGHTGDIPAQTGRDPVYIGP